MIEVMSKRAKQIGRIFENGRLSTKYGMLILAPLTVLYVATAVLGTSNLIWYNLATGILVASIIVIFFMVGIETRRYIQIPMSMLIMIGVSIELVAIMAMLTSPPPIEAIYASLKYMFTFGYLAFAVALMGASAQNHRPAG